MYLLDLSEEKNPLSQPLKDFLNRAGNQKETPNGIALKDRYKYASRTPWYGVPIVKKGGGNFLTIRSVSPSIYK